MASTPRVSLFRNNWKQAKTYTSKDQGTNIQNITLSNKKSNSHIE
jgi:hypothetical protein